MKTLTKDRILRALSPPGRTAALALTVAFAAILSAAACDFAPTGPGALARITVFPNTSMDIGATQQFSAMGQTATGVVVPISPTWSVVAGGGNIDSDGLFTAGVVPGAFTGTVMAASDGVIGTASVTVSAQLPPGTRR